MVLLGRLQRWVLACMVPARQLLAPGFAARMYDQVAGLRGQGFSLRRIADELNGRGIATARGRGWAPQQVRAILGRSSTVDEAGLIASLAFATVG